MTDLERGPSSEGESAICASSLNKSPDPHSIVERYIEAVRHYLHLQIGKPVSKHLISAPEIALNNLRDEAATIISELQAERDRLERNRDMWKGQCERQAASLTTMRDLLSRVSQLGATGGWRRMPDGGLFSATPLADDIASAIRSLTNGGSGAEDGAAG